MKLSEKLKTRLVSGFTLAPLVLLSLYVGGWPFMALITAGAALSFYEWIGIVMKLRLFPLHLLIGFLYISFCFLTAIYMRVGFDQGAWLILCLFLAVWASDIGAYITGKAFGGPKMAPWVSPNKTWAGLFGAMVFFGGALVILFFLEMLAAPYLKAGLNLKLSALPFLFLGGCVLGFIGQAGDLFISFYKRLAQVKDSGSVIPGHGGLLDRIDALMLVCPAFLAMAVLWVI